MGYTCLIMFVFFLLSRKVVDEDGGNDSDEEAKRSKMVRMTCMMYSCFFLYNKIEFF